MKSLKLLQLHEPQSCDLQAWADCPVCAVYHCQGPAGPVYLHKHTHNAGLPVWVRGTAPCITSEARKATRDGSMLDTAMVLATPAS